MSGVKYSRFELERQRAERLRLVQDIKGEQDKLSGILARVRAMLDEASAGLRESFSGEVRQVESFLSGMRIPKTDALTADSPQSELSRVRGELEELSRKAAEVQRNLVTTFGKKADEVGRALTAQLADVEQVFAGEQTLLGMWCAKSQMTSWTEQLRAARARLAEQRYGEAGPALGRLLDEIKAGAAQARRREELHQKRVYVLNAINKVCKARGFERVSGPQFDDESDRGSRIVMVFDTLAKGKIEFSLELDGIHANSEISGASCFEDFDELSNSLADLFGIETHFTRDDGARPIDETAKGKGEGSANQTITRISGQRRNA